MSCGIRKFFRTQNSGSAYLTVQILIFFAATAFLQLIKIWHGAKIKAEIESSRERQIIPSNKNRTDGSTESSIARQTPGFFQSKTQSPIYRGEENSAHRKINRKCAVEKPHNRMRQIYKRKAKTAETPDLFEYFGCFIIL